MKVTLTPSGDQSKMRDVSFMYKTVTLDHPSDELGVQSAMELICQALVAWGYDAQNIGDMLYPDVADEFGLPREISVDDPAIANEYMPKFEGDPDDCKLEKKEVEKTSKKFLAYKTDWTSGAKYVTYKQIENKFGTDWAQKFSKAMGPGNTMIMVEEGDEQVSGIYPEDWERFRDVVDQGHTTYFD